MKYKKKINKLATLNGQIYTKERQNCAQKAAYKSENEADKIAELIMLQNLRIEIGTYQCPVCNKWHLTRKN